MLTPLALPTAFLSKKAVHHTTVGTKQAPAMPMKNLIAYKPASEVAMSVPSSLRASRNVRAESTSCRLLKSALPRSRYSPWTLVMVPASPQGMAAEKRMPTMTRRCRRRRRISLLAHAPTAPRKLETTHGTKAITERTSNEAHTESCRESDLRRVRKSQLGAGLGNDSEPSDPRCSS